MTRSLAASRMIFVNAVRQFNRVKALNRYRISLQRFNDLTLQRFPSLARVMWRGWFRFSSFLRRLLIRFHPLGVEYARFVDPFISVCAKEVALGLKQIRWQTR